MSEEEQIETAQQEILEESVEVKKPKKDSDVRWREKYKIEHEEREKINARYEFDKKELTTKIEAVHQEKKMFESKFIESEVKVHAIAAGIKDHDLIKLIDISHLKLTETGSVEGIQELINDFKAKKPDFFGSDKKISSSLNPPFPKEEHAQLEDAHSMSDREWALTKNNLKRGIY